MKVTVAKTAGFCFGVRRALQLTEESAARTSTCTLGELIHNRQVVEQLAGQGVAAIERPEDAPAGMTVVIRSHGVPPQVTAALFVRTFGRMVVLSAVLAYAACVAGLCLSFIFGIPSGATIILVSILLYLVCRTIKTLRSRFLKV